MKFKLTKKAGSEMTRKYLLVICLLITFLSTSNAQSLVWEENFDGTSINSDNWTFDFGTGNWGWGNGEFQYYTSRPENARIEDGSLLIEARREAFQGSQFTSARLKSAGRVQFKYGTIEARIKVSNLQNGLWPAFWLLGASGTWPMNGEIDIMEMGMAEAISSGTVNKSVASTLHWAAGTSHQYLGKEYTSTTNLTDDYHIYKTVWNSDFISVSIDGKEYFKYDISKGEAADLEEFHNAKFLIINLAVGGQFTGLMDAGKITAPFPGKMHVDYIKLYQDEEGELYLGNENAFAGNFGIYSENPSIVNKLDYTSDSRIDYWANTISNITTPAPTAFEGKESLALRVASGSWFGMGISTSAKNLSNFVNGSLKFQFKTSYSGQLKFGIHTAHGESWLSIPAGATKYGIKRDGQWSEVTIPVKDFINPDLGMNVDLVTVLQPFMFAGDPVASQADFYFDNIHYSGGNPENPAPVVNLTAPVPDALFTTGSNIQLNATATDANGTVAKVDFFNGNIKIGTSTKSPFTFTWPAVKAGVYNIKAKAYDNLGAVTVSKSALIYVANSSNSAPSISITSPKSSDNLVTPASVKIEANATDSDGHVYKVEFYNGNTLLGTDYTSPFSFNLPNLIPGTYSIRAIATDNGKLTSSAAPVKIVVKENLVTETSFGVFTESPSITNKLILKQDAEVFLWTGLDVITSATAQEGKEVLALKVDPSKGWFGMGIQNNVKNLINFGSGSLRLHFKTTYSGGFKFGISTSSGESWVAFAAGEQKYGLMRNGQWNQVVIPMSAFSNINLSTVAQAFMFVNDGGVSAGDFFIDNIYYTGGSGNTPPTVAMSSPSNNANFADGSTITLTAAAIDNGGVALVEFFADGNKIGESKSAPYSVQWFEAKSGTYSVFARATDNVGAPKTSEAISVTVGTTSVCSLPPTITIDAPLNEAVFTTPASIKVSATAKSGCPDRTITKVEFLNGSSPIATVTSAPYETVFSVSDQGVYQITARTTDSKGGVSTSTISVTVRTTTCSAPPTIVLDPINTVVPSFPATINLSATAKVGCGNRPITSVEFRNGSNLISIDTSAPYTGVWTVTAPGTYTISAKVTDITGGSATATQSVTFSGDAHTIPGTIEAETYASMSGIQLEKESDSGTGQNVGWIDTGDWLDYKVIVSEAGSYKVDFRVASLDGGGALQLRVGATTLTSATIDKTGGWQNWTTLSREVNLTQGSHTYRVHASAGGFNLNWIKFTKSCTATAITPQYSVNSGALQQSSTISISAGSTLLLSPTPASGGSWKWTGPNNFSLTSREVSVKNIQAISDGKYTAQYTNTQGCVSSISYNVTVISGRPLSERIEAEDYSSMSGIQTETTLDADGGENVGWIDSGDFMEYLVNVQTSGTYKVTYRVASLHGGGSLQLRSGSVTLATTAIGATGGWQNWANVTSTSFNLPAGPLRLRLHAAAGGFNINYMNFALNSGSNSVCSETSANGDYQYDVLTTINNMVNYKFSPMDPIAGTSMVLIHIKTGNGAYSGYQMTPSNGNFTFSQQQIANTALTFYFTYRVGSTTMERNSSANPHTYIVGTTCGTSRMEFPESSFESKLEIYPNPVANTLKISAAEYFESGLLSVRNSIGKEVIKGRISSEMVDVSSLPAGVYTLTLINGKGKFEKRFIKE